MKIWLLLACLACCAYMHWWLDFDTPDVTPRTPTPHEVFTIVQFADLHFGEDAAKDQNSTRVMRTVLQSEPAVDFVVFSGDQVSGWAVDKSAVLSHLSNAVGSVGVRYATIFGNHDDQPYAFSPDAWFLWTRQISFFTAIVLGFSAATRRYRKYSIGIFFILATVVYIMLLVRPSKKVRTIMQASESNLSSSRPGPDNVHGVSNFFIPVQNQSVLLLFLDSGGGRLPEQIHDDQVDWVRSVAAKFPRSISLAFIHIPLPEYVTAGCFGDYGEPPSSVKGEHKSLYKCLEDIGTKAIFVGHDHLNSCCYVSSVPALCYGRHTGYGGYGDGLRGARVISVSHSRVTTWLRLEDATKRDEMDLYLRKDGRRE